MPVMLSEPVASAVAAESLVASVEAAALEEVVLLAELPQAAKESAMQAAMVKARYFFMCDLLIFLSGAHGLHPLAYILLYRLAVLFSMCKALQKHDYPIFV